MTKAKKVPKISSETKAEMEAFEAKLEATAAEKREEQATVQAAAGASEEDAQQCDMDSGMICTTLNTEYACTVAG